MEEREESDLEEFVKRTSKYKILQVCARAFNYGIETLHFFQHIHTLLY